MPMSVNFDFPTDQEVCQGFEISMKIMFIKLDVRANNYAGTDLI